ncbi:MAG: hypothetical protein JNJ85_07985 [Candidatus Kapabacteria bacterium]|nr:hypothetical protein [Candidatus Kapabacteria bacterium]MBX7154390.1 carboxypeptidase-like regulatory domain-containing protein [Bacteroidota bacterium]
MKTFHVVLTILTIFMTGCFNNTEQPLVPNKTQTNGNGKIYGQVLYTGYFNPPMTEKGHAGTVVSVLGTNITTTSDEYGYWQLSGLDSGTYTILFERNGCETFESKGMYTNGDDSVEFKSKWKDYNGTYHEQLGRLYLMEKQPTVALTKPSCSIECTINTHRHPHDSTIIVGYDTVYSFNGNVSVEISANRVELWKNLPFGIVYKIDNKSYLDKYSIPPDSLILHSQEYSEIWRTLDLLSGSGSASKRTINDVYDLKSFENRQGIDIKRYLELQKITIKPKQQLYLHTFPMWRYMDYTMGYDTLIGTTIKYGSANATKYGDVVTIPIQWK